MATDSKLAPFMATVLAAGGLGIGLDALTRGTTDAKDVLSTQAGQKVKILSEANPAICRVTKQDATACEVTMFVNADEPIASIGALIATRSGEVKPEVGAPAGSPSGSMVTKGLQSLRLTLKTQHGPWRDFLPASGILTTAGAGGAEYLRPIRILLGDGSSWESVVIAVPATVTLVGALITALILKKKGNTKLTDRMGSPAWRGSDSWSSNVTVGASLVNGLLTLSVLSDQTVYMSKTTYGVVNVILNSILALAPVVYSLFRTRVGGNPQNVSVEDRTSLLQPETDQFEGHVAAFLAAGWLTLWANIGQLVVFSLLVCELRHLLIISNFTQYLLLIASVLVALGLLAYGFISLYGAAKAKSRTAEASAPKAAREGAQPQAPPRAQSWSML